MVSVNGPRNRGPNVGVVFDLGVFTEKLFSALGAEVRFTGPGPAELHWVGNSPGGLHAFAIEHLAKELFTKYDDGKPSAEKRRKALQRFMEGECNCALTNFKFSPLPSGQPPSWLDEDALSEDDPLRLDAAVFTLAKKHISRALGAFPGWGEVLKYADFGPGATTRLPRRMSHRSNKWAGRPHATIFLESPLDCLFEAYPLISRRFAGSEAEICLGNKLDWVPKNYKTDRTIAIEPDWNMFLQKGIGGLLRRRLKRVGQDLDDQSTNRFLAAVGSITGELATLDLSMASDTVAYRLVEYLVRPDWFEALVQCRSPVGFYEDEGVENAVIFEKFSSMGNGYTFELETLLFWGILRAVSELSGESDHRLYAYGDDLVVPSGMSELAMEYLAKAGFLVNPDKSFSQGPFRESCGGHYYRGDDVTPFYVREAVDSIDRLFLLHNNVYRWFNRLPWICDPGTVRDILQWIRDHAPQEWRKPRLLSEDVGDGGFIGSFDEVTPTAVGNSKRKRGWEGWKVETLQYSRRIPRRPSKRSKARKKDKPCLDEHCTCSKCERNRYPEGSGPDLMSLWAMEKRINATPWLGREETASWLSAVASKDAIDAHFGFVSKDEDVPYAERHWCVGMQVLPWTPGCSWF